MGRRAHERATGSLLLLMVGSGALASSLASSAAREGDPRRDASTLCAEPLPGAPAVERVRLPSPPAALANGERSAPRVRGGVTHRSYSLVVHVTPLELGEREVVLRRGNLEWARGRTRSGVLELRGLEPGRYLLRCEPVEGWFPELTERDAWHDAEGTWMGVELEGESAVVHTEWRLVPEASLSGIVRDVEGAPLAARIVHVRSSDTHRAPRSTHTDEAGTFRLEGLAPGSYDVVVPPNADPASPRAALVVPRTQVLAPGEAGWIELGFEAGPGEIEGRVVDEESRPVPGLRLLCSLPGSKREEGPSASAERVLARTRTDAQGRFRFTGLPALRVSIAVAPRESRRRARGRPRTLRSAFAPREVHPHGSAVDLGDLRVERPETFELAGRLSPAGAERAASVPMVELVARERSAGPAIPLDVDEAGAFRYRGELPAHALELRVSGGGGRSTRFPLRPRPGERLYREVAWP